MVYFLVNFIASWHWSPSVSQDIADNNRQDNRFMYVKKLNIRQHYDFSLFSHQYKGEFHVRSNFGLAFAFSEQQQIQQVVFAVAQIETLIAQATN